MAFLLNSQAQGASDKMNNLPKHHGARPPEARGPMQLHRLKAGTEWKDTSLEIYLNVRFNGLPYIYT